MEFLASKPLTVGMELELQLLDPDTLDLVESIMPLMEFFPDSEFVKPEFIQNTVEITCKVSRNVQEAEQHLLSVARDVRQQCEKLNMRLCGAGSHPFCTHLALITPLPRYLKMEKVGGYMAHSQITFATHVHIGMRSGDEAIRVMRELKPYLPFLIAISANSPFWRGYDTGFVCYRHRILSATRSYGIPPTFQDWQQFCEFFDTIQTAGMYESINQIHWDIRPRPHLGTLEIRVMDAQSSVHDAAVMSALVRTLVTFLRDNPEPYETDDGLPRPLPWWIEKDNYYEASRLGYRTSLILTESGHHTKVDRIWQALLPHLSPVAGELGESDYIEYLDEKISRQDYPHCHQQETWKNTGSLQEVTRMLAAGMDLELASSAD